ncbi:mitochondrial proton/calcium exchanger protein-like [Schistocerca gregaria]|uniref:mitochondrial proton/calcium exchanger protein-like n=1 Tax=Schistocerca gregaria TaxID=7010 RepID=UPI00211E7FCC|nr:mitochondrial proton/calcium exchanger protein-like [Schistocerca gregaria]
MLSVNLRPSNLIKYKFGRKASKSRYSLDVQKPPTWRCYVQQNGAQNKKEQATNLQKFLATLSTIRSEGIIFTKQLYRGSKELYANWKKASEIKSRKRMGHVISWREERFVQKNKSELQKMVPYVVFQFLPGSLLLVIGLMTLFPNSLPTAYRTAYLNNIIENNLKKRRQQAALDLIEFFKREIEQLNQPSQIFGLENLLKRIDNRALIGHEHIASFNNSQFAKHFDIMEWKHSQLLSACRLFGLSSIRVLPTPLLLYQASKHMGQLTHSDKIISILDFDEATDQELTEMCIERGLPWAGLSRDKLLYLIKEWCLISKSPATPYSLFLLFSSASTLSIEKELCKK